MFSNKITVYDSENVSGDMQWAKTKNGSFRSQDGTIWVDINAQQGVLGALSHELTHMVSLLDESTFKKISEILIDEYADITKTKSVEDYIREYEERLNLGTKAAYEEFVADCMTNMLTDTNAAETIVKMRNTMNEKTQNKFIKLINDTIRTLKSFVKRSNAIEAASITSQLKSLQKISDLWAQGVSNAMTEFEKTENKGKTVETDKYSVKYTDKNNPVVVVNDDISRGVLNDKELVKAVKNSLSKFKYVPIDKQKIYFTTDTKKETTYSQYTKWLRNNKADVYQDKMRLLNHPVDVILATTNYVNEGLKHSRKDNIVDFARGNLLLDILGNKYEANVVIGFTKYGMCELYDIVNMKPTTFEYKKEASYKDSSSKKGLSQKGNASFNNIISTNTGKSQEKFSLKTNVEETKDLIAVHNLTEANLLKSLELGGLPMPSIAIIKAKSSHSRYGDISLVFNKSTIDPEGSKYNKVYGGDAWTPTYPTIEYKANEKVAVKINKLYYDLAKKYGYDEARPLYNLAQDLEDELNRHNGEKQYPIMGCYGIGVGRLAASICEVHHDEYGPVWPLAVAPWQVHICAVRADDAEVKAYADKLYEKLQSKGVEVIYDDRKVSPGVMFSDADLIGVPFRIIVSPRNMKKNIVEIVSRDKSFSANAPMDSAANEMLKILSEAK